MLKKSLSCAIALAMILCCFSAIPGSVKAGLFTDVGGPDATFRDAEWHSQDGYAVAVGNDSSGNGVVYFHDPADSSWAPLATVSGDSYNAVTQTEPFIWYDNMEGGQNGWTSDAWYTSEGSPLVAEWKLDEGAGTDIYDTSGNDHHGTLINANLGTCWIDGMSDKALNFDSPTDYVEVNNVEGLTSGSFTGSCWFNLSSHVNAAGIVNKYSGAQAGWGIWNLAGGEIRYFAYDGTSSSARDTAPVSLNKWHHIAWVYNDTAETVDFYLDGDVVISQSSVNPGRMRSTLEIGYYTAYLDGKVDEVKIYDRALTISEILDYYNETIHMMGEWQFEETWGQLANDTSQNDFNGTLMPTYPGNVPTWIPSGFAGNSMYFDGIDDRVETDYIPNTFNIHDHSIEAWIYPTANITGAVIYGVGEAALSGQTLEFKIDMGEIQIWHWGGAGTWNWYTGLYVPINDWSFLTYTYDADIKTGYIYINGEYKGNFEFIGSLDINNDSTTPSQIGRSIPGRQFQGYLDEVAIYNYTMPPNTVFKHIYEDYMDILHNGSRIGEWKFEEASGSIAKDSSQNDNDGTLMPDYGGGNAPTRVDYLAGTALHFDGVDDYVTMGNNPPWNFGVVDFSIKFWIKPVGDSVSINGHDSILAIGNDGADIELWITYGGADIATNGNHIWLHANYDTGAWGFNVDSGINLNDNNWHMITVTKSGSDWNMTIDTTERISQTYPFSPSSGELKIAEHLGGDRHFKGLIDEVQIWNRVLNASEISESFYSALTPFWHQVDPSTLPTPGSGRIHGNAYGGSNIWWFGRNPSGSYNDGSRVAGSLVTPPVYLSEASTMSRLVFSHWADVEPGNPGHDIMNVSIKNTTDLGWYQLKYWDSNSPPASGWTQENLNISAWLGNYVQVNFTFDSVDADLNDFAGWHIDDLLIYTNDAFIVVGDIPTNLGYSVYATDVLGTHKNIDGMKSLAFNDVAAGSIPATFVAVGNAGAARYWNGSAWNVLTGPAAGDKLKGIDFNGTHFFIVGYDSISRGVAYYITERELKNGIYALHTIPNAPDAELNAIDWSNEPLMGNGQQGLGLVCANGAVYGLMNPEPWRQQTPGTSPSPRQYHAMAYDSANNKVVLFGGLNGGYLDDTWTYDVASNTWNNENPATAPSPRRSHAMAYDSANNKIVLFGGYNGVGPCDGETWTYDVASNTWNNENPGAPPSPRDSHSMTYDSANNKIVMFGGSDGLGGYYGDTWTYDVASNTWNNENPGTQPSSRYGHAMAYDSANNKTVMFGGTSGISLGDTWTYDVATNTWNNENPASAPSSRYRHAMAYDSENNKVILFGGASGIYLGDTRTYDTGTNTWSEEDGALSPMARSNHAIVYDSNRRTTVLFGGDDGSNLHNDTWHLEIGLNPWGNAGGVESGVNYTAVTWNDAGTRAIFVGNTGSGAEVWHYYAGDNFVSQIPDYGGVFTGHQLYGAAYQPDIGTSTEVLLVGASAFKIKPNEFDQSSTITLNANYPHIFDLWMWEKFDPLNASTLNSRVYGEETYVFRAEVNYTASGLNQFYSGGGDNVRVNLTAWFDDGGATESNPPTGDDQHRTRAFSAVWNEGAGVGLDSGTMTYPVGAPNEFVLHSSGIEAAGNHYYIYFNVTFGAQSRAADGGGAFGADVAGTAAMHDTGLAFDDPNSWNFNITIYDNTFTDAYNSSHEEFGIYKAANISAAGNPSGNAPPGSASVFLNNPSQVTYASNAPYYVNVSIADLDQVSGSDKITANWINITVDGASQTYLIMTNATSEINYAYYPAGIPFAGANQDLVIWGNSSAAGAIMAPQNGTTQHGPYGSDFNFYSGPTQIQWYATVPAATSEGIYQATITFTIEA